MERPPPYVEVRVTAPDAETASRIARVLVDERLAACVQVLPGITSVYRWEGTVEVATEHLLLVKSTSDRFEAIRRRVRAEHPYDTPEILAVAVVAADERYAAWLDASTAIGGTDDTHDTDGAEGGSDGGVARSEQPDGGRTPRQ